MACSAGQLAWMSASSSTRMATSPRKPAGAHLTPRVPQVNIYAYDREGRRPPPPRSPTEGPFVYPPRVRAAARSPGTEHCDCSSPPSLHERDRAMVVERPARRMTLRQL